jgi:hypothetical protein
MNQCDTTLDLSLDQDLPVSANVSCSAPIAREHAIPRADANLFKRYYNLPCFPTPRWPAAVDAFNHVRSNTSNMN